jgi:hypothetical protein
VWLLRVLEILLSVVSTTILAFKTTRFLVFALRVLFTLKAIVFPESSIISKNEGLLLSPVLTYATVPTSLISSSEQGRSERGCDLVETRYEKSQISVCFETWFSTVVILNECFVSYDINYVHNHFYNELEK